MRLCTGVRRCEDGRWWLGGLGAFTRLTPQLQAAREIPAGDPGLQGHQLLGGVLQEVGDVGLDVAKTAGDGLGAGEGDVTTASLLASSQAEGLPLPATRLERPRSQRESSDHASPWLLRGSILSNTQQQGPRKPLLECI